MKFIIFIFTLALTLTGCFHSTIKPIPSETSPNSAPTKNLALKTLSTSVRDELGAKNPLDLIIRVGADGTVTLYGAPGKKFKVLNKKTGYVTYQSNVNLKALNKETNKDYKIVNDIHVLTLRNSPPCNFYYDTGNKVWYPASSCP